jgi:hypothetical protein
MKVKIAAALKILLAILAGVIIAPYITNIFQHRIDKYETSDNKTIYPNTEESSESDEGISEDPPEQIPDENVEIDRKLAGVFLGSEIYKWYVKNISDNPIELYNIQINNRNDCVLVFKQFTGMKKSTNDKIIKSNYYNKGDILGIMLLDSDNLWGIDNIIENIESINLNVGHSVELKYPAFCGEPVIIKAETKHQFITKRF